MSQYISILEKFGVWVFIGITSAAVLGYVSKIFFQYVKESVKNLQDREDKYISYLENSNNDLREVIKQNTETMREVIYMLRNIKNIEK